MLEKDKFMPEMHLRQPGFTYSARGPFTKKEHKKLKEQEIHNIFINISQIKLVFTTAWLIKILTI